MRNRFLLLLLAGGILLQFPASAQKNTNQRALWFTDARFGMFIHWGVYSGAEGIWKGEKHRDDNDYAEWIYYRNRIDREEYLTLLDRFRWEDIDPEEWVLLAKEAGMKYVTLTAKHHDGFALWDSQVSDYDVADYTDPKRDIVGELADACGKHGLKLGLYYSHWVDWEHPGGWDHSKEIYGITPEEFDGYWQGKVMPQMRELLTNYGDIGLIWFDMWIHHSNTCVSSEQLLQLKGLIRELQPNCLVNSRLGLSIEEDPDIDFKTLGDNQLGSRKEDFPWQSPGTVAHSWGYHALEDQWKSTTTLLHWLINNVSLNGNYMLNIGPRANGAVPHEISNRLREMGKWLEKNGDAIYGSQAFDLVKDQHPWGRITCRTESSGKTILYLLVYNWPLNQLLPLTGVNGAPERVYLLADPDKNPLAFNHRESWTEILLPEQAPDPRVSVVALEYDKYPETTDGLVSRGVYGGYALKPEWTVRSQGNTDMEPGQKRGSVPAHIRLDQKSSYTWKIYIPAEGSYYVDVSYNFQGKEPGGLLQVETAGQQLKKSFVPTGRFVGEPNRGWHIDSFNSHRLGKINFPGPGYYELVLELKPKKGTTTGFQWVWLEPDHN